MRAEEVIKEAASLRDYWLHIGVRKVKAGQLAAEYAERLYFSVQNRVIEEALK